MPSAHSCSFSKKDTNKTKQKKSAGIGDHLQASSSSFLLLFFFFLNHIKWTILAGSPRCVRTSETSERTQQRYGKLSHEQLSISFQRFYIPTSRQLVRLEAKNRSPVYSFFSETVAGTSVVRAFGAQSRFIEQLESRVNENNRFRFYSYAANR